MALAAITSSAVVPLYRSQRLRAQRDTRNSVAPGTSPSQQCNKRLAEPKHDASSQVTGFAFISSKGEAWLESNQFGVKKGEENETVRKKRFGGLDFGRPGIMFGSKGDRRFLRVLTQHTAQRVCACFNTV